MTGYGSPIQRQYVRYCEQMAAQRRDPQTFELFKTLPYAVRIRLAMGEDILVTELKYPAKPESDTPNGDKVRAFYHARWEDRRNRIRYQDYQRMIESLGETPVDYQAYLLLRKHVLGLFNSELSENPETKA